MARNRLSYWVFNWTLVTNPYTANCYAPAELGYNLYAVSPNGTLRTAGQFAKRTILADTIIRYDFELGNDDDFNDLSVRVNDEGHRSFIATIMNSEVRGGYAVHLQLLGNGSVEKDVLLSSKPKASLNVPKRIVLNQYVSVCSDSKNFCPAHITKYLRKGGNNDPAEVSKLQSFLGEQEGSFALQVTGVFDAATDAAVRNFQEKHSGIVLGPWVIQKGTGYVYKTTLKRINDLYCAQKNG